MVAEEISGDKSGSGDEDGEPGAGEVRTNGNQTGIFQRLLGWLGLRKHNESSLREAVEEVLEEHEEYTDEGLDPEEKSLIKNILHFGEIEVSDVMIPQSEMVTVEHDISQQELLQVFTEHRHTRLPVYKDSIDNIVGFLHVKDMLPVLAGTVKFSMDKLLRKILFVPPSMRIADLLVQMRQSAVHMAIVVDEYGGTSGLVTLEDLFEEIVGEIQDEHDDGDEEPSFSWTDDGDVVVDASVRIDKLESDLDINLLNGEDEDFDTLGGLIFSVIGRVPRKGEKVDIVNSGITIEILDADERRINRVRLLK